MPRPAAEVRLELVRRALDRCHRKLAETHHKRRLLQDRQDRDELAPALGQAVEEWAVLIELATQEERRLVALASRQAADA